MYTYECNMYPSIPSIHPSNHLPIINLNFLHLGSIRKLQRHRRVKLLSQCDITPTIEWQSWNQPIISALHAIITCCAIILWHQNLNLSWRFYSNSTYSLILNYSLFFDVVSNDIHSELSAERLVKGCKHLVLRCISSGDRSFVHIRVSYWALGYLYAMWY